MRQISLINVAILSMSIRVVHLGLFLVLDAAFADYDSSVLLRPAGTTQNSPLESLMVWDSVFFTQVSKGGYEYEQFFAFFPLFPFLSSLLGPRLIALSSFIISLLSSVMMATSFAWLSVRVLNDDTLAARSTLLLLLNQACTFHTAAYTESLFGALTMAGLCCLYRDRSSFVCLTSASLLFTLASASRSNGVIYAGYLLHYCIERALSLLETGCSQRRDPAAGRSRRWRLLPRAMLWILIGLLTSALVFISIIVFQLHGHKAFCLHSVIQPDAPRPLWCQDWPIPRVYSHVQSHYWGVGLLKYWQLKNLPNFLLAAPSLLLTALGCFDYAIHSPHHLWLIIQGGLRPLQPLIRVKKGYYSPAVAVHLLPWAVMASCALLLMHVQVATRFLSSCPASYWFAAHIITEADSPRGSFWVKRCIWSLNLSYTLVGSLLFVNFYPWT